MELQVLKSRKFYSNVCIMYIIIQSESDSFVVQCTFHSITKFKVKVELVLPYMKGHALEPIKSQTTGHSQLFYVCFIYK